jgi:PAS domain S-box-containing protein
MSNRVDEKGESMESSAMWVALSESDRHKLKAAQIRQLYSQALPGVFFGAAFTVVVLPAALWSVMPRWLLITWGLIGLTMYLARQRLVAAFEARSPSDEETSRWGTWFACGTWTGGILWGVAAFFLFPTESVLHQALLASLIAGVCAGTIAATCPRKEVYLPFVTIVLLALAGRYFYEGGSTHSTMGVTAVVLLGIFIVIGNRMHVTNTESLKLRFRNEDLFRELTEKEARAKALNEELKSEITERMQAEAAQRQSEERYRQLVENANDFIYAADAEGRFTFANPVALRITGYSEQEILGKNYRNLVPQAYWEQLEQFYRSKHDETKSETHMEIPILTKAGELIWTGQNLQWIVEGDRVSGFQGICRDISERKRAEDALREAHDMLEIRVQERTAELSEANERLKEEIAERERTERLLEEAHFQLEEKARECFVSEERFRTVFETAQDFITIKDSRLKYTHVNPAGLGLLDRPISEVIGKDDAELSFAGFYGWHGRSLEKRVLDGESVETEHTVLWKGWPICLNVARFPLKDSSGKILGVCAIARDVSDRKKVESPQGSNLGPEYPSATMGRTMENIRQAGEMDSTVLLLGETGSGKDYLARYLHDRSVRTGGPFFAINCAALSPTLVESELFGHEKGAFTGALARKRGLLELAEGGTLLLNEIGEMSVSLQAKLLSFLDTGSFTRVGGERSVSPDSRIIAATNRDLKKEIERGTFRKDLFYRLSVISITVPPLRERREDFPALVKDLLSPLCQRMGIPELPAIDTNALEAMMDYHWPGNVRELQNALERALIRWDGVKITANDLEIPWKSTKDHHDAVQSPLEAVLTPGQSLPKILEETKRRLITYALSHSEGQIKEASNLLGVSYESLRYQIRSLGIGK